MWSVVKIDNLYRVVWNIPYGAVVIKKFRTKYKAITYFYDRCC